MYYFDRDFGFIAHPRCASRTTRDILMEAGAQKANGHHQIDENRIRDILQAGGIMCCTTRNMFDLIVSWYFNQHINHEGKPLNPSLKIPSFEKYLLEELIPKPKHRWFMTPIFHYGITWCTRIMKYENLDLELKKLFEDLHLGKPEIGHVGRSVGKRPYREYYNTITRKAVEDRWGMDLHICNQEF